MGKPMMLRTEDDERIERLKRRLKARTKVDVVRAGLDLLEQEAERRERVDRWRKAARAARPSSLATLRAFQRHARLGRDD